MNQAIKEIYFTYFGGFKLQNTRKPYVMVRIDNANYPYKYNTLSGLCGRAIFI